MLSLIGRERIPVVPVASQEEARSTRKVRGTPGSFHHSKSPPDVSVLYRGTCLPCTASTFTRRTDTHDGGTWDSPVGKPRGKTRNPLINPTGKLTLLLMLGRKAHAHAPIGDEDDSPVETPVVPQDPFQHWRGNLRFGHRLQKRS